MMSESLGSCLHRALLLGAVLSLTAASADAHMTLLPRSATAGTPAKLDFRAFHGCQDRPTISVTVKIPEGFLLPAPQAKAGWTISTKSAPYSSTFQIADRLVEEGFTEVTWSGGSLPADYMDEFSIVGMLPQRPGEQLTFPVIQGCLAADGKATEQREFALSISLEAQPEGGAAAASPAGERDADTGDGGKPGQEAPTGSRTSLILSGLALVLSLVALLRGRRW